MHQDHTYSGYLHADINHVVKEEIVKSPDFLEEIIISSDSWRVGRRVVELDVLAKALDACSQCRCPLQLSSCIGETKQGLGSVLKVLCKFCEFVNVVPTGKRHGFRNKTWDANTKLAMSMINAGIGQDQINKLLTGLNIPKVNPSTLKTREEEIGVVIEEVAKNSTTQALLEEKKLRKAPKNTLTYQLHSETNGGITASVDGGWQTRGSGRSYNSLSGHCTMIGSKNGKVVAYSVRSKKCRRCERGGKVGKIKKHRCVKNWSGSAKAMEADMIVEMVKECKDHNTDVKTIVGDEDVSTITKLHNEVDATITKMSDKNHIKKILSNDLYAASARHKQLSVMVVRYIQKCFNYLISQNKENTENVVKGLKSLSRHPFGDHSMCDSWCSHKDNPTKPFKSLPHGRPLTDTSLQQTLESIFSKFINKADKLTNLNSTQSNESMNNSIASKAPKSKFYAGSQSLNFRIGSAVAQKNIGNTYINEVNKQIGLSPGEHTLSLGKLKDEISKRKHEASKTREAKLTRIHLKAAKCSTVAGQEIREGPTYSTSIDLSTDPLETEKIPDGIEPPLVIPPPVELVSSMKVIYFDLETTGFGASAHITQMAACTTDSAFQQYVIPKRPIPERVTEVTGLSYSKTNGMCHHGKPVDAVPIQDALAQFFKYVGQNAVLVGHNCKIFDCRVLMSAMESCDIESSNYKYIFLDTLPLIKCAKPGLSSYKQTDLFSVIVGGTYNAHDAASDVKSLCDIMNKLQLPTDLQVKHMFDFEFIKESMLYINLKKQNIATLQRLKDAEVVSQSMIDKIAGSGLNYHHLQLAFNRDPQMGISSLFSERRRDGKARVSKTKAIIDKINDFFVKM